MKRLSILNCIAATLFGMFLSSFVGCAGGDKKVNEASSGSQVSQADNKTPEAQTSIETVSPGEAEFSSPNAETSNKDANPVQTPPAVVDTQLEGVWYGESVFDVDAFNARLAQLEPQQAEKLQEMVRTFSTIVMAAEFRSDSAMELDMMLTMKDGQQLRDRSVGTWSIVQKTATGLKIETKEYRNAEQQPTQKVYVYQFLDKDRFQFVPEAVSPDIREFSPRIVFQRVEQPLDDAAIAEQQDSKIVR